MQGEVNHERLCTLKNNLRVLERRGLGCWVSLVVGIMGGMHCMEYRCGAYAMNSATLKSNLIFFKGDMRLYLRTVPG